MWDRGTCRNTSREIDEMIGRIMIASTTEAVKSEFLPGLSPPNSGNQPNAALRNRLTSSMCRDRKRSEEHTSELQSRENLVCRLLLEKKKTQKIVKQRIY